MLKKEYICKDDYDIKNILKGDQISFDFQWSEMLDFWEYVYVLWLYLISSTQKKTFCLGLHNIVVIVWTFLQEIFKDKFDYYPYQTSEQWFYKIILHLFEILKELIGEYETIFTFHEKAYGLYMLKNHEI